MDRGYSVSLEVSLRAWDTIDIHYKIACLVCRSAWRIPKTVRTINSVPQMDAVRDDNNDSKREGRDILVSIVLIDCP